MSEATLDRQRLDLNQHRAESQKATLTEHLRCTRQHFCREDAERMNAPAAVATKPIDA
jgi:hypothetical protein